MSGQDVAAAGACSDESAEDGGQGEAPSSPLPKATQEPGCAVTPLQGSPGSWPGQELPLEVGGDECPLEERRAASPCWLVTEVEPEPAVRIQPSWERWAVAADTELAFAKAEGSLATERSGNSGPLGNSGHQGKRVPLSLRWELDEASLGKDWVATAENMALRGLLLYSLVGALLGLIWLGALLARNGPSRPCRTSTDDGALQDGSHQQISLALPVLSAMIAAPGAVWLAYVAASPHLIAAACLAALNWALHVSVLLNALRTCSWPQLPKAAHVLILLICTVLLISTLVWCCVLTLWRLTVLEGSSRERLGAHRVWRLVCLAPPLSGLYVITLYISVPALTTLMSIVVLFSWAAGNVLLVRSLVKSQRLADSAVARAPEHRAAQAKSAAAALRVQTRGAVAALVTGTLHLFMSMLKQEEIWPPPPSAGSNAMLAVLLVQRLAQLLDTAGKTYFALALSGALSGAANSAASCAAAARSRKERWLRAATAWSGQRGAAATPQKDLGQAWDQVVWQLAGRGVELRALLSFYRDLPHLMPGFDAARHTTADVVQHAIIPLSASRGCPCAEVLMQGKYTRPNKMVTHNWSNLFRDLLAAIIADALEEADYCMIAVLLTHDFDLLERWILERKLGSRAYWICAFSVNQHLGICGTWEPKCPCATAKAWNFTPPLIPDGRSIPCEMNKFDDMMRYLSATDPLFEQIVAVDVRFGIFKRAWCIAELAAANEVGMLQTLKVHSAGNLAQHTQELKALSIEDMEASQPEDKQLILDSIQDVAAFDASLQRLLFNDLIPAWSSLDGAEQMAMAGRIIRWHQTSFWNKGLRCDW